MKFKVIEYVPEMLHSFRCLILEGELKGYSILISLDSHPYFSNLPPESIVGKTFSIERDAFGIIFALDIISEVREIPEA